MRLVTQMAKNTQYKYLQGYETTGTPTLLVGDKNAETTSGNYLLVLCKLYTSLLHEPVIPLLIIYLGQMKTFLHKDLLRIFTAVLLIIANTKWHKCLSTDEWKKGNSGKFIQQNTTQQSKEWTVGTCNNIAESQNINNYGEYKKPDKKRIYTKWLCL